MKWSAAAHLLYARTMTMTSFTDLLRTLSLDGETYQAAVPEDWRQGRTTYGGLSAAIALTAARRAVPDLPPLRTAQVGFIGPATGIQSITPHLLRSGKSMTFVATDTVGDAGPCTRCLFGFGAARESTIDYDDVPMPDVPEPDECIPFEGPMTPAFLQHYDTRIAAGQLPFTGSEEARYLLWVRHRDPDARQGETPLLALADAPPPAFLSMLAAPAPTASVTWQADFLTDEHDSEDGWYLCGATGDGAVHGYGGQSQMVWARDGEPVIAARQAVVVFG